MMKIRFLPVMMSVILTLGSVPLTQAEWQQATSGKPEFEAASIKPDNSLNGVSGGCHGNDTGKQASTASTVPLGRCVIASARLSHLIAIAYDIRIDKIKGGPDWVWGADRFDVEAKAENPSTVTAEQLSSMLQNLLADRFRLKLHRESRQVSGHTLVVAKNGPKLKDAIGDGRSSLRISGAAIFKPDALERRNLDQNSIIGQRVTMSQLASALSNLPDGGPVIDQTGLSGPYDFKLSWEPGESLSSVLQEQLGLRLESQKVPIEVVVIDSAEKPTQD
jgi:uncharacterized protein (TIGR03435 family)